MDVETMVSPDATDSAFGRTAPLEPGGACGCQDLRRSGPRQAGRCPTYRARTGHRRTRIGAVPSRPAEADRIEDRTMLDGHPRILADLRARLAEPQRVYHGQAH